MRARLALGLAAAAGYAALCYWLMLHAANAPWAVAALFGPWLVPLLALSWRRRQPLLLAAALAATVALVLWVAAGGLGDVKRLYLLQHVAIHAALALGFGSTLRAGSRPLIGALALRVHGHLTPTMDAYTRRVTTAWTVYFGGMAVLSLLVYALLPWTAWSLLANLLTPLSLVAMFIGEYILRYRWHPEFERVTVQQMLGAFRQHQDAQAPATAQPGAPR